MIPIDRLARRAAAAVLGLAAAMHGPARAFDEPLALPPGAEQIVFATRGQGPDGHYYANFGYYCFDPDQKVYATGGGGLWKWNARTDRVECLLRDDEGAVRDPRVDYDATKVLFSYRRGGSDHYHLHEINLDGSGLKQLTDGPFDDVEPAYLPDGGIAFCSSRCNRWVMCWKTPVAILYRCDGDGRGIRPLSSNASTENTPSVLPDGRILFTRWEYVDRSQLCYHHLWTANPDGTGVMAFFGNMYPIGMSYNIAHRQGTLVDYDNVPGAVAMLDARPVPGTDEVLAVFSPGHGRAEHAGHLTLIDPRGGPDHAPSARQLHPGGDWRDPFPVSRDRFLAARGRELHLIDREGTTRRLHALRDVPESWSLHEPQAVAARPRERVIPSRVEPGVTTGTFVLADVARGRNMEGVRPGEIAKLLILEQLPGPFHNSPGFDGISLWGTFTLTRILGTVPVERDGSAHFEAPAMRSLHFVALDADGIAVKKMQSFVTVQPGEVTGCVGCHEGRQTAPSRADNRPLAALARPPSPIEAIPDLPEIVDFRRHIQPILDTYCVECHGPERHDADLRLDADHDVPSHGRGQVLSSYVALVRREGEIADGRNAHGNRAPREIGSGGSKLMTRIRGEHHGVVVPETERALIRLWLDSGAAANGTYAVMDGGTPERPSPLYIREMKRYGILPADFRSDRDPIDAYATDQAYWRSFWLEPRAR